MFNILNPLVLPKVTSLAFNAENPHGRKGAAAGEASPLGAGRKGSPCAVLPENGELVLADVAGPGMIRHIWLTVASSTEAGPFVLRDLVLKCWWDDANEPSVVVPLGDFFCSGGAEHSRVDSLPIVVAPTSGFNCYFQMPFRKRARIVVQNQHGGPVRDVFYQVDATVGDEVGEDAGYFHADWRRSNATTALGQDHVILDGVAGRGAYAGTFISYTSLERYWWGEGEVKFYVDGDTDLPSLCSTGLEDYAGGAWAFQDELRKTPEPVAQTFSSHSFGFTRVAERDSTLASPFVRSMPPHYDMYRWHLLDPIVFEQDLRVTMQQIGCWDKGLFERSDDVATVAYFYLDRPMGVGAHLGDAASRRPR